VVPGLELPVYGNYVMFAIRGVSSQGAGLGDSSNVALYVDGVYQASQQTQTVDFPDVENIQVLKGPQGTLYGKNAVGGAIIITTMAPSFTMKGKITASYGNYNDKHVYGYITGPISDTVAVLLSGSVQDRRGFRKDLLRGGHDKGLRQHLIKGKLLWQPDDDVSFTFTGFTRQHNDSNSIAGFPLDNNSIGYGLADQYNIPIPRAGKKSFAMDFEPDGRLKNWGVSLNGEIGTSIGQLSTVTAYYDMDYHSFQDPDYTPIHYGQVDLRVKGDVFIQELNFGSDPIGPLLITAGASYIHRTEHYAPQLFNALYFGGPPRVYPQTPITLLVIGGRSDMHKNSYAAYLEGDLEVTEQLTLTLGGQLYHRKAGLCHREAFPSHPLWTASEQSGQIRQVHPARGLAL
jgi:iron complex outermembrane receptor protein